MKKEFIIDGHVHCGPRIYKGLRLTDNELSNTFDRLKKNLDEIGVAGAVLLPFPEDIYRKPYATPETAKQAHDYILEMAASNKNFYPFYFVWNDFVIPENLSVFKGVKFHRHFWSEPEYNYADPKCDRFMAEVRRLDLPVILEDSFEYTKAFCAQYRDVKVIVPHVGLANGKAYQIIPALKNFPNVYIETSLAYPYEIVEAIRQFGVDRVMFGSDTPYSSTKIELFNLREYDLLKILSEEDKAKILARNMLKLMNV